MANSPGGMSSNPFFMIVGLGVGAAALIAIAIAATTPHVGVAVGSGPQVEVVEEDEPATADDALEEPASEEMTEEAAPVEEEAAPAEEEAAPAEEEAAPAEEEAAPAEEEAAPVEEEAAPAEEEAVPAEEAASEIDASEAVEEATDGDVVGSEAPDPETAVVEQSGNAVSPEDTGTLTTPTADEAAEAPAGETAAPAGDAPAEADSDASVTTESGLVIDQVVDPDRGAAGGPDPDGGAAPFFPTPSGPEGADGDPLTTN